MFEGFVPLDVFLTATSTEPSQPSVGPPPEPVVPEELEATLRAARRFRAALSDALDAALPPLLRAIADDVLARELRLEPVAIARVVAVAMERAANEHAVAIRVHPGEREAVVPLGFATIADAGLSAGDCRIVLRSGTIDASLSLRLETVLAAHTP